MIDVKYFFDILCGYNSAYGTVEHFIVGECVYIKTYNGGWSHNECVDSDLFSKFSSSIIVNDHPITIYKFYLLSLRLKNKDLLLKTSDIREEFEYKVRAEDEGKKHYEFVKHYLDNKSLDKTE